MIINRGRIFFWFRCISNGIYVYDVTISVLIEDRPRSKSSKYKTNQAASLLSVNMIKLNYVIPISDLGK